MIPLTAQQAAVVATRNRTEAIRFEVEQLDGTWADLTTGFRGSGPRVTSFEMDSGDLDQTHATGSVTLWRRQAWSNLSPFVEQSRVNRDAAGAYSPAVDVSRRFRMSAYIGPLGYTPAPSEFQVFFSGTITDVDPAAGVDTMRLELVDDAGTIAPVFIQDRREYGNDDGSVALESVLLSMLSDNGLGPHVPLYVPTPSGWAVRQYTQQNQALLAAMIHAASYRGMMLRQRWRVSANAFALTLFEPDREKTTPDYTFQPAQQIRVTECKESNHDIRTKVGGRYWDKQEGRYKDVLPIEDAAATALYGPYGQPIYMQLLADENSGIHTEAEMLVFMQAALKDLASPRATRTCETPFFPWAELCDLYTFAADGEISDVAQTLATVGVRHAWDEKKGGRTTMQCRGRLASARRFYLDRDPRGKPRPSVIPRIELATAALTSATAFEVSVVADPLAAAEVHYREYDPAGAGSWGSWTFLSSGNTGTLTGTALRSRARHFEFAAADNAGVLGPAKPSQVDKLPTDPPTAAIEQNPSTASTALVANLRLTGALATDAPGPLEWRRRTDTGSAIGTWTTWADSPALPQTISTTRDYRLQITERLEVRDGTGKVTPDEYLVAPAMLDPPLAAIEQDTAASTRYDAMLLLTGAVVAPSPGPLEWRWRTDTGAAPGSWSAWVTTALPAAVTVARDAILEKRVLLQTRDQATQRVNEASTTVLGRLGLLADDGSNIAPGSGASDGVGVRGVPRGMLLVTGKNGDTFMFGETYASVPAAFTLDGGLIGAQTASVWGTKSAVDAGTASSAPPAGVPVKRHQHILTQSSITIYSYQIGAGTNTPGSATFAAPTSVSAVGANTGRATPASGAVPAVDNTYTVQVTVNVPYLPPTPGGAHAGYVVLGLLYEENDGAFGLVEVSTLPVYFNNSGPGAFSRTVSLSGAVAGLAGGNDHFRVTAKSAATSSGGPLAFSATTGNLTWTYNTGAQYAAHATADAPVSVLVTLLG